jgi:hypothetical protein
MHRAAAHSDGQVMLFSVGIVWRRMEHLIDQLQMVFESWGVLIVYSKLVMLVVRWKRSPIWLLLPLPFPYECLVLTSLWFISRCIQVEDL